MSPLFVISGGLYAVKAFLKKRQESPLPSFIGILETVHYLPGRLRLRLPTYIKQNSAYEKLRDRLLGVSPISKVNCNPNSGSLLIHFDEQGIEPLLLQGVVIRLAGLDVLMQGQRQPWLSNIVKDSSKMVNDSIYDTSKGLLDVKTLLFLFFAYAGSLWRFSQFL